MSTDLTAQRAGRGYEAGPVTKVPEWHGLVAWDMLFNNLTTGLFLVAALSELAKPDVFLPVAKVAYPLALVLLLTDLVCLVLDLGDPLRFHHMLRLFKLTSPMSLGTWCLTIYSLPLTVAAALSVLPAESPALEWARKTALVVGLLPALGSAVYKGVLLSTTAQPGWRSLRWLGGYLTNSALMLGCAALLAVATLLGQDKAAACLRPALVLLVVLNLIPLGLGVMNLRAAVSGIHMPRPFGRFAAISVGVGTLIPLFLLLAGRSGFLVLPAVLLVLLGSLGVRFVIVRLPHAFS